MIPLPKSYEVRLPPLSLDRSSIHLSLKAAVNEARLVFKPYIGLQFQASDIILKCAIKRAYGTGAWGVLRPTDWRSVIRPDGDEVGVFLRQDSLDLPYEPTIMMESNEVGSNLEVCVLLSGLANLNRNAYYHLNTFSCSIHSTIIPLHPPLEPSGREKSCA